MGGQNHQPCNQCIRHATVLSKTFSLAQSEFLQANAVLEDALIAELYDSPDHASHFAAQIVPHLDRSVAFVEETAAMATTILDVMKITPFQNVKALDAMDVPAFGKTLEAKGMIARDDEMWAEAAQTILTQGFEGMFRAFLVRFETLKSETLELRRSTDKALRAREQGAKMITALEQNDFDLKTHFARLLTSWNRTARLFLYSSLISTETHLRTYGFKSLEAA